MFVTPFVVCKKVSFGVDTDVEKAREKLDEYFEIDESDKKMITVKKFLFSLAQDYFVDIIKCELDLLYEIQKDQKQYQEYLADIFTMAFVRRNSDRALAIIYDLLEIAKGKVVRDTLPPLHIFAMCNILSNHADDINDSGKGYSKDYIDKLEDCKDDIIKVFDKDYYEYIVKEWFDDPYQIVNDFIESYDDEYIYIDQWESTLFAVISNPNNWEAITKEAEEMFLLFPDDMLNAYYSIKQQKEREYTMNMGAKSYDFFISHASEDKSTIAEPLALKLIDLGAKVWLDKFEIKIGDSLKKSIEDGILHSKYGVVIMSPIFFQKFWTDKELNTLFAKWSSGVDKVILPILHNMPHDELLRRSPLLADVYALNTTDYTIDDLAQKLFDVI